MLMSDLDLALEILDRRIAELVKARDALREALSVLLLTKEETVKETVTGTSEVGTLSLETVKAALSNQCGCGRAIKHSGRCWFRRGYKNANESHKLPHQHAERLPQGPDGEEPASSYIGATGKLQEDGSVHYNSFPSQKAHGEEMIDVETLAEQAVKRREHSIAPSDTAAEKAKSRIKELKRIGKQREQENIQKHLVIKDYQLRARGICPKCKGPMGHSPYQVCHGCMGKASQKIEAASRSGAPVGTVGGGFQFGGGTPSLSE